MKLTHKRKLIQGFEYSAGIGGRKLQFRKIAKKNATKKERQNIKKLYETNS